MKKKLISTIAAAGIAIGTFNLNNNSYAQEPNSVSSNETQGGNQFLDGIFGIIIESQRDREKERERKRHLKNPKLIEVANFYLKTPGLEGKGRQVYGRIVNETNFDIVLEEPLDNRLITNRYRTFRLEEIEKHTLPEMKYYTDLGEYFLSRTGDFENDSQDFMQAIVCYEKARRITLDTFGPNSLESEQIDERLRIIGQDRDIYERELRKMNDLKKIEISVQDSMKIDEIYKMLIDIRRENKIFRYEFKKIEQSLSKINSGVEENKNSLKDIWFNIKSRPGQRRGLP